MKTYLVTIKAEIYKTIPVLAESEEDAEFNAHGIFTCTVDDSPEKYDQQTISITTMG
jgi:hypothetical protein